VIRPWLKLSVLCVALLACDPKVSSDAGGPSQGATQDAGVDPELVRFTTADGWQIVGDLRVRQPRSLGVVFVHQLGSNRGEWARFAGRVAGSPLWLDSPGRFTTLAFDLRGHGESTTSADGTARWQSFGNDRARWISLEHDVAAAVDLVRQRALTTRIVIVASGIGATAAALYAARPGAPVAGLVLISPTMDARGINLVAPLTQYVRAQRPVLLVTASGDSASSDCVRDVQQAMSSADAGVGSDLLEVERYDNASAHGVAIGAEGVHPELWARIDRFFADRMRVRR
jgi:pimeloyl-ACP methyl ester carboxylesterase